MPKPPPPRTGRCAIWWPEPSKPDRRPRRRPPPRRRIEPPPSEWQAFLNMLELQPDGSRINPNGTDDPAFFEAMDEIRLGGQRELYESSPCWQVIKALRPNSLSVIFAT